MKYAIHIFHVPTQQTWQSDFWCPEIELNEDMMKEIVENYSCQSNHIINKGVFITVKKFETYIPPTILRDCVVTLKFKN